jgi:hypothetical protein
MKFESSSAISKGLGNALEIVSEVGSLPFIRGQWYYVDPTSGADTSDGRTVDTALANLDEAYSRASDGDGIALLSYGATSAATTSYLKQELPWTKNGITVFGIAAPVAMFSRARVANKTVTTTAALSVIAGALTTITRASGSFLTDGWEAGMKFTCAGDQTTSHVVSSVSALSLVSTTDLVASAGGISSITSYNINLMTLSGANNRFYNVHFYNGGTASVELGGVVISGSRNYFEKCHLVGGAGSATAAGKFDLKIDTGEENTFQSCTIGSDSFAEGDNAATEIVLNGVVKRNRFKDCEIIAMVSAGTAHGAVKSVSTSGGSPTVFKSCLFNYSLSTTTPAAAHLVSGSVDKVIFQDCAAVKVTAWGTYVYANMIAPTATAGGGLSTTA